MRESDERLRSFVRAASGPVPEVDADRAFWILINSTQTVGLDDRALIKLALVGISFCQVLGEVARGEFELTGREGEVLAAVIRYVDGIGPPCRALLDREGKEDPS